MEEELIKKIEKVLFSDLTSISKIHKIEHLLEKFKEKQKRSNKKNFFRETFRNMKGLNEL